MVTRLIQMMKKHEPQRSWVPDLVSTQVKGLKTAECPRDSRVPVCPHLFGPWLSAGTDLKEMGLLSQLDFLFWFLSGCFLLS